MRSLDAHGFVAPLRDAVSKNKPLLGICVGLQMLFEGSDESPGVAGLGLLKGRVRRFEGAAFQGANALKIPQIGWNVLSFPAQNLSNGPHPLFRGLAQQQYVYFVHSYFAQPADDSDVLAWSDYGQRFCAAAGKDNIAGVQFHPEKSQTVGLQILKNFGN
jgi:glutamine amidotransferase